MYKKCIRSVTSPPLQLQARPEIWLSNRPGWVTCCRNPRRRDRWPAPSGSAATLSDGGGMVSSTSMFASAPPVLFHLCLSCGNLHLVAVFILELLVFVLRSTIRLRLHGHSWAWLGYLVTILLSDLVVIFSTQRGGRPGEAWRSPYQWYPAGNVSGQETPWSCELGLVRLGVDTLSRQLHQDRSDGKDRAKV